MAKLVYMNSREQFGMPASPESEPFDIEKIDQESWERLMSLMGQAQDRPDATPEQNEAWANEVIRTLSSAAASRVVKNM